ncbi:hypothetical protein CYMTET_7481, partial [Cymbomonas tetramitiformis]
MTISLRAGVQRVAKAHAGIPQGRVSHASFQLRLAPQRRGACILVARFNLARRLLRSEVTCSAEDGTSPGALREAAERGDLRKLVDLLREGVNPNDCEEQDEDECSPLHVAAFHGHTKVAEALIEAGADIDARGNGLCTPLHVAAGNGFTETALALIEA